jgi:heme O synthase-like polyprenyltransferase
LEKQIELQAFTHSENMIWRDLIHITKPRIILSNLIAAFGGFWLASQGDVNWILMLNMLIGSTLVLASACAFNNYLDRKMDQKMARTRNRPLPSGRLQPYFVFWYGVALGIRRKEEYRDAGFPLLPVVKGVLRTKLQMIPYIVLLIPTSLLLYSYHYVGKFYLFSAVILGLIWLAYCIAGFFTKNEEVWAKKRSCFQYII